MSLQSMCHYTRIKSKYYRTNCIKEINMTHQHHKHSKSFIVKMLIAATPKKKYIFTVFLNIKIINLKLQPENENQLQLAYHKILQRCWRKTSPLISKYCQLEHTITLPLKQTQHDTMNVILVYVYSWFTHKCLQTTTCGTFTYNIIRSHIAYK